MSELNKFLKLKQDEKSQMIEGKSKETLLYYEKIGEMLNNQEYYASETFLYSVQQWIENHEYITDKQKEIVDKIYDHPNGEY